MRSAGNSDPAPKIDHCFSFRRPNERWGSLAVVRPKRVPGRLCGGKSGRKVIEAVVRRAARHRQMWVCIDVPAPQVQVALAAKARVVTLRKHVLFGEPKLGVISILEVRVCFVLLYARNSDRHN